MNVKIITLYLSLFLVMCTISNAAETPHQQYQSGFGYGYAPKKTGQEIPFEKNRLFILQDNFVWTRGSDGIIQWSLHEKTSEGEPRKLYTYDPQIIKTSDPQDFAVSPNNSTAVTSYPAKLIEITDLLKKKAYTFRLPNADYTCECTPVAVDEYGNIFVSYENIACVITEKENVSYKLNTNIPSKTTITNLKYKAEIGLAALYQNKEKNINEIIVWDPQQKTQRIKTNVYNKNPLLLPSHFDFDLKQIITQNELNQLTIFTKKTYNQPETNSHQFIFDLENTYKSQLNQIIAPIIMTDNKAAFYFLNPNQNYCSPKIIVFEYDPEKKKTISTTEFKSFSFNVSYDKKTLSNAIIHLYWDKKKKILNSMSSGGVSQLNLLDLDKKIDEIVDEFHIVDDKE